MIYIPKYPEFSSHKEGNTLLDRLDKEGKLQEAWRILRHTLNSDQIRSIFWETEPVSEQEIILMKEMNLELTEVRCITHDAQVLGLIEVKK